MLVEQTNSQRISYRLYNDTEDCINIYMERMVRNVLYSQFMKLMRRRRDPRAWFVMLVVRG